MSASLDGIHAAPKTEFVHATTPTPAGVRLRVAGLLIVLAVAILPLLLASSAVVLFHLEMPSSGPELRYRYVNALVLELTSLALLLYVVRQNGRRLLDFGLNFRRVDILHAFLLLAGGRLVYKVALRVQELIIGHHANRPSIPAMALGLSFLTLWFVAVNPFFEELIVRAFLISEIIALTGNSILGVAVSVIVQTAYHLYQGFPYALASSATFLVFSVYYVRTRRILPVILAHLWLDLWPLVLYPLMRAAHS